MSSSKKDRAKQNGPPPSPEAQQSANRRPRTFVQRLSSIMPSLGHRKSTLNGRSRSAPPVLEPHSRSRSRRAAHPNADEDHHPLLPSSLHVSTLSDPGEACPYDPTTYYSFPTIDEPASNFLCGLISAHRSRSRSRESAARKLARVRPCLACRSGSACSHITITGVRYRLENRPVSIRRIFDERSLLQRPTSPLARILNEETLDPRPYTATPSAARVRFQDETGRGRGRVRLPVLPPLNTLLSPNRVSEGSPASSTPTSPRLHHIHGLPRAAEYPYVHKHEVARHLAAHAAGAPSPVIHPRTTSSSRSRSRSTSTSPPPIDFSETIHYAGGVSPVPRRPTPGIMLGSNPPTHTRRRNLEPSGRSRSRLDPIQLDPLPRPNSYCPHLQPLWSPQSLTLSVSPSSTHSSSLLAHPSPPSPAPATLETVQAVGSVIVDSTGRPISVDPELDSTRVYSQARSLPPYSTDESNDADEESTFSTGTVPRTPSVFGGRQLDLRGGSTDAVARLRGGDDRSRPWTWNTVRPRSSILWRLKRRILTCAGSYETSEEEDLPAPRRMRRVFLRKRLLRNGVASPNKIAEPEFWGPAPVSNTERIGLEVWDSNAKVNSFYFDGRTFGVLPSPPITRPPTPWPSRSPSPSPSPKLSIVSSSSSVSLDLSLLPSPNISILNLNPRPLSSAHFPDPNCPSPNPPHLVPAIPTISTNALSTPSCLHTTLTLDPSTPNLSTSSPHPLPRLRGGSGTLKDSDNLPQALFYLAGGLGPASTAGQWRKQRPKKRMGGLLGMAIFGSKAGTAYDGENEEVSTTSSSFSSGSSGILGKVEREGNVKSGRGVGSEKGVGDGGRASRPGRLGSEAGSLRSSSVLGSSMSSLSSSYGSRRASLRSGVGLAVDGSVRSNRGSSSRAGGGDGSTPV